MAYKYVLRLSDILIRSVDLTNKPVLKIILRKMMDMVIELYHEYVKVKIPVKSGTKKEAKICYYFMPLVSACSTLLTRYFTT